MSDLLNGLHTSLRWSHVGLGFSVLVLFWIIAALPKGTRVHRGCGKIYVFFAYVVGGTALISSSWAILHLDSFAPFIGAIETSSRQAQLREQFRFMFAILLYLSVAILTGAAYGVRLIRSRERHFELRHSMVPFWLLLSGLCSIGLMAFGMFRMTTGPQGDFPWVAYQIPLFLGFFGIFGVWQEVRYVYGQEPGHRAWLYKHIEQMFGTGIGFHTAFIVFGSSRLFGYRLSGAWALLPWVAPVLGIALTHWYVRRLKRKNGDLVSRRNDDRRDASPVDHSSETARVSD